MLERYEQLMQPARERVHTHPGVAALMDPGVPARTLHRFLIQYCALGVQVTAPVDGWIRRAGQRCREVGLPALGDSLVKHADHEAGHDRLFVDDTHSLVRAYGARYGERLDAERLLAQPATPAMQRYIELHERTIASDTPYGQVAIELEIEGLSVSLGPALIDQFARVLGPEILECLTFLREHVAVDVGHTALNRKMLGRLLTAKPEAIEALARTGTQALEAYIDFMAECFDAARTASTASTASAPLASAQAG